MQQLFDLGCRLFGAAPKRVIEWYDGPLAYTVELDGKTYLAYFVNDDREKFEMTYMFFVDRDGLVDRVADSKIPILDFCRQIGRAILVRGSFDQAKVMSVEVKPFMTLLELGYIPDDVHLTFERTPELTYNGW